MPEYPFEPKSNPHLLPGQFWGVSRGHYTAIGRNRVVRGFIILVARTGVYENMKRAMVALVFRCKATAGDLTINDEVTAFRWATADDIRDLADEAYAVRVLDALHEEDHPAVVRHHDGVHPT
jgi:hypothetical protein